VPIVSSGRLSQCKNGEMSCKPTSGHDTIHCTHMKDRGSWLWTGMANSKSVFVFAKHEDGRLLHSLMKRRVDLQVAIFARSHRYGPEIPSFFGGTDEGICAISIFCTIELGYDVEWEWEGGIIR